MLHSATRMCLRAPAMAVFAAMLAAVIHPARAWDQAHGDSANTGFVDVRTRPARLPSRKLENLGQAAPGAGPVVGLDGAVYLGTREGKLHAFNPNGEPRWTASLPSGYTIQASPAVGMDKTIFVVAGRVARDHTDSNGEVVQRFDSLLLRFDAAGTLLSRTAFPTHEPERYGTGATSAPPMLWRSEGREVVMVPAIYRGVLGFDVRLIAFSSDGSALHDQLVTQVSYGDLTGGSGLNWYCFIMLCYNDLYGLEDTTLKPGENELPAGTVPPLPGVGMFGAANPVVVVADDDEDIVGYRFSESAGFAESFRKHLANDRLAMSSPTLLRDGHSVITASHGEQGWLLYGGPNVQNWTETVVPLATATPTLDANGRIIAVARDGTVRAVTTFPDRTVVASASLGAETIAPAAASCSHIFVSTASALVTLNVDTLTEVTRFTWNDGGLSPPAIGPRGHVYAAADNSLFVFAAPTPGPFDRVFRSCRDVLVGGGLIDPNPAAAGSP